MPQAGDEQRAVWGIDSAFAVSFLEARGYVLTDHWSWRLPPGQEEPCDDEWSAIAFLVDEWDYGAIARDDPS